MLLNWYCRAQCHLSDQRGANMVEYILIAAVIIIAAMTALTNVGEEVTRVLKKVRDTLAKG